MSNFQETKYRHLVKYNPNEDGITHINAYSKGRTELGRALTHFSPIGFDYYEAGRFASLEAFWHWAKTGKKHDYLKSLYGFKAKQEGEKLPKIEYEQFLTDIEEVVKLKIVQNPQLLKDFKESTLPIVHYYVVGHGLDKVAIYTDTSTWFEYYYCRLRDILNKKISARGQRVSVTGSRTINDYTLVCSTVKDSRFNIAEVVSGGAKGVDALAEQYAKDRNIPFKLFPADWKAEPRRAGFIRNAEMAEYVDAGVVIWDGESNGTKHYQDCMSQLNKSMYVVSSPTR